MREMKIKGFFCGCHKISTTEYYFFKRTVCISVKHEKSKIKEPWNKRHLLGLSKRQNSD